MQTAQEMIAENGLKPTKARISILNIMLNSKKALSHHDILALLQGVKEIDRVTVYRVLDWLLEHDFVHRISGDDRVWKYQLNSTERSFKPPSGSQSQLLNNHSHAHLHCQSCHTVLCLDELAANIPKEIFGDYQISNVELNLKGVCKECQHT